MGKFLEIISGWSQIQSEIVEDKAVQFEYTVLILVLYVN